MEALLPAVEFLKSLPVAIQLFSAEVNAGTMEGLGWSLEAL